MHAAVRPGGLCSPSLHDRKDATDESTTTETTASSHRRRTDTNRFPLSVSTIAAGLALVDRNEFAKRFDMGVPLDASLPHNDKVLLIYQRPYSLPKNKLAAEQATASGNVPLLSVNDATENCDFLNIVLSEAKTNRAQCLAVMGQYESFHIQKFMRLDDIKSPINRKLPLRMVNRGSQANGRKSTVPPDKEVTLKYWDILSLYLSRLPSKLDLLRPIAQQVAKENTVIVLVCNHGQSELLMNFICAARARGFDLSAVLLFATDEETQELGNSLGITTWYDADVSNSDCVCMPLSIVVCGGYHLSVSHTTLYITPHYTPQHTPFQTFGAMPKNAARRYADVSFTAMMMAKVWCVQMIMMLGYDVLFQDVDVVWYRDPLEFFHNSTQAWYDFDIYFQDDGNHALYYAPYSANTGFYYVRNNDRTQYFFNSFLLAGDLVLSTHSHQVALIAVLNEHASMYGLKVKVLPRDGDDFPGGYHFHNRKPYMHDFFKGVVKPYIFHMSWTLSKANKLKYFQQMGEWFLDDRCAGKTKNQIGHVPDCCLAEPAITCHYRDKPSKIPCPGKPVIDKGRASFW